MILFYKRDKIETDKIKFNQRFQYSKDYFFIPIQYDNKDILIQTPNMYIPFNINEYSENNRKYLDLSFQKNNEIFIKDFLEVFYKKVKERYGNYEINDFIKKNDYSKWMRFKLNDKCLFFDQNKNKIDKFNSKTFGTFIIQLNGLWVVKGKLWFYWTILQGKINTNTILNEYSFIDEPKKIPIPPPPPPPPLPKKNVSRIIIKKKESTNKTKENDNDNDFVPSLDEIKLALQSLQKI